MLHGADDEARAAQGRPALARARRRPRRPGRAPRRAERAPRAAAPPARAPRRCPAAATTLPHARRLQRRAQGPRREEPEPRASSSRCRTRPTAARTSSASRSPRTSTATTASPAFFNMGVHHAREWPAGEHAMEWALELVNGYKERRRPRDEGRREQPQHRRADRQPRRLRGLAHRRRARRPGRRPRRERSHDTAYLVAGATTGGEYRRKNCRLPDDSEAGNCTTSAGLAENGVDPNRNYGGLWGGPGADTNPLTQTYRGPGPFSEPETRNIQSRRLAQPGDVADHQPHHRRPRAARARPGRARRPGRRGPGLQGARRRDGQGERLLQPEGLRALRHDRHDRGLELQRHGRLRLHVRDLLRRAQLRDGRLRRPGLPPDATSAWSRSGTAPTRTADHTNDPGPNKGYDGKGNREAYYIAAESALNEQRHSVLEGQRAARHHAAPDARTFKTADVPAGADGAKSRSRSTTSSRRSTTSATTARSAGTSTRRRGRSWPRPRGKENAGPPSPPETPQRQPGRAPPTTRSTTAPRPAATPTPNNPLNYNDHPITVPAAGDNESMAVQGRVADADERLRRQALRGLQRRRHARRTASRVVGTEPERRDQRGGRSPPSRPGLQPGKKYVLRVNNFAAAEPYTVTDHLRRAAAVQARAGRELHAHLRARRAVFDTQQVQIDRGQVKQLDLQACAAAIQRACAASTIGLRSVSAARRGGGVRFGFRRFARRPVQIDVFQVSRGSRVIGERLVGALQGPLEGRDLERPGERGAVRRRLLLRPLPDEDARRQGHGDAPRHAAAPQRPLLAPAGLLPARHVRPAAELQARAGRVRRHAAHRRCGSPSASRRGARPGDRPARQEGRQALQGHDRRAPSARTASSSPRASCRAATTGSASPSAAARAASSPRWSAAP